MKARTIAICAFGTVLLTHGLEGQGLAQYRNFALKSDPALVAALAGVAVSEVKVTHQRPVVMQDLEWRLSRWIASSSEGSTDPVEQMVFSFYNNQLFRIVVEYAYDRTEGMTDADMIGAISAVYGTPVKRAAAAARAATRVEIESGLPVARWGDAKQSVVLYPKLDVPADIPTDGDRSRSR